MYSNWAEMTTAALNDWQLSDIEILNQDFADLDVTVSVSTGGGGFDIFDNQTGNHITTCCDLQEVEATLDGCF